MERPVILRACNTARPVHASQPPVDYRTFRGCDAFLSSGLSCVNRDETFRTPSCESCSQTPLVFGSRTRQEAKGLHEKGGALRLPVLVKGQAAIRTSTAGRAECSDGQRAFRKARGWAELRASLLPRPQPANCCWGRGRSEDRK